MICATEPNESLIERGRILMDIGFLRSSKREIPTHTLISSF